MNWLPNPLCAATLTVCSLAGLVQGAEAAREKRPNFVFILVDDLRWDAMSCMGHPIARTPNVDRLAANGARFSNAFVTTSLCAPSRASFLTGLYTHTNGVRTNEKQEYDHALPTFPKLLQEAGYETGFIGKWHMKPTSDPRPGFDYWLSFQGQGVYIDPQLNENGRTFKATGYMTDLLTGYAVDFLKKPREKPFSLCLWHKAVHGPFTPADRHNDLYKNARLPEPESFRDTFKGKPAWQRALVDRTARRANTRPAASVAPEGWEGTRWINYYRTLAAVDESVGRVLAVLKETGQLDNTYIIYAGDNGFFQGEHRRGDKRLAYEESIRIPLIMQGPGIGPSGVINAMALNIDIAPTLLDLAGVKPPASMQGRSLRPAFDGQAPGDWRSSFLYEYFKEAWLPQIPDMVGVRGERYKYVTYPGLDDIDELYDLRTDPHELRNLAEDPAHAATLEKMRAELQRLAKATGRELILDK